jgi:hypothetical protein
MSSHIDFNARASARANRVFVIGVIARSGRVDGKIDGHGKKLRPGTFHRQTAPAPALAKLEKPHA